MRWPIKKVDGINESFFKKLAINSTAIQSQFEYRSVFHHLTADIANGRYPECISAQYISVLEENKAKQNCDFSLSLLLFVSICCIFLLLSFIHIYIYVKRQA